MISRDWLLHKPSGQYICPECSHTRKKSKDRCLTITNKDDVVLYYCHHCNIKGGVFYEEKKTNRQYNTIRRGTKDKQENSGGFKSRKWSSPIW